MRQKNFHELTRRDLVLMMAEEILSMDSEIEHLRARNKHLEEMKDLYFQAFKDTEKHTNKMTGAMFLAAIGANDAAVDLLESE